MPTRPLVALAFVLMLVGSALAAAASAPPSPAAPEGGTPLRASITGAAAPSAASQPSGYLQIFQEGPGYATTASGQLNVQFQFRVVPGNYSPSDVGLLVRVPGGVAKFPVADGTLTIPRGTQNLNITGPGWVLSSNVSALVPPETLFDSSGGAGAAAAVFSTQTAAVTTQNPWGTIALEFEWAWTLVTPVNTTTSSDEVIQTVVPGQYAQLASTSSHNLAAGKSFNVCLTGPVFGREFSLLVENATTEVSFGPANATIPSSTPLPYCWGLSIPSGTGPQMVTAQVWNFENLSSPVPTSLLLFVIPLSIANATTSNPTLFDVPLSAWLAVATVGAVAVAVGLVVYGLLRLATRPGGRRPPPVEFTPPAPSPTAPSASPQGPPPGAVGGAGDFGRK
ncbi:MAG: hypothetical protein WBE40_07885 [Thermoplasmata archaeon]